MRRLLAFAFLSLAALAAAAGPAAAWCNFSFGIGIGGSWQSGGNCFGCGLWNNGQYPCYPGYGSYPLGYPAPPYAYAPAPAVPYVGPGTSPNGAYTGYGCPPFGGSPNLPVFFGWTPQTDYIVRD